jgi:hypothetical protein
MFVGPRKRCPLPLSLQPRPRKPKATKREWRPPENASSAMRQRILSTILWKPFSIHLNNTRVLNNALGVLKGWGY